MASKKSPTNKLFNAEKWVKAMEALGNQFYLQNGAWCTSYADNKYGEGGLHDGEKELALYRALRQDNDANIAKVIQYLKDNVQKYGYGTAPLGTEPHEAFAHLETGIRNDMRFYRFKAEDDAMQPRIYKGASVDFFPWESASTVDGATPDCVVHFIDGRLMARTLVKWRQNGKVIVRFYHPHTVDEAIDPELIRNIYPIIR